MPTTVVNGNYIYIYIYVPTTLVNGNKKLDVDYSLRNANRSLLERLNNNSIIKKLGFQTDV